MRHMPHRDRGDNGRPGWIRGGASNRVVGAQVEGSVKRRTLIVAWLVVAVLASASSASAQLVAAKNGPVVYGHHHIYATNIEEHKKFFVDTLGGVAIKVGTNNRRRVTGGTGRLGDRVRARTG
jgi:hypothetical protein